MLDQKPYLMRAFYDWIVESGCTPYIQVLATYPGAQVPAGADEEGIAVLNISPSATNQLHLGKEAISFLARFRGQPMGVHIPMGALLAIFAKENGQGMGFPLPDAEDMDEAALALTTAKATTSATATATSTTPTVKKKSADRSHLKVIK